MIIKSILDTDLYKFTTSYAYMKMFPQAIGTFAFTDRDHTKYTEEFLENLRLEFYNLAQLRFTKDEEDYMKNNCRFLPGLYWEWLSSFRFNASKIHAWLDDNQELHIEVKDLMYKVTLYEVPILAMVSELRNRMLGFTVDINYVKNATLEKIKISNSCGLNFSEFGTRRRFNFNVQDQVMSLIKDNSIYCTGTSNCYLAMKYDMKMMGTHPHEWFMFHGAQYGYRHANYMALENWMNVYDGDLGIALSDTYTSDVFFRNFSRKHAKTFDGIRQDSGDPFAFVNKAIARYKELGIDPTTKTIIFSDSLDFPKAQDIALYCMTRIRCSFGIGTNLTNDTGNKPANIIMKLVSCRMNSNQQEYACVKLSDVEGKHNGPEKEVNKCLTDLDLKND